MTRPDTIVRSEGMTALIEKLGEVDAERFIALIIREPFDYTKWRENLFENETLESLAAKASEFSKTLEKK